MTFFDNIASISVRLSLYGTKIQKEVPILFMCSLMNAFLKTASVDSTAATQKIVESTILLISSWRRTTVVTDTVVSPADLDEVLNVSTD